MAKITLQAIEIAAKDMGVTVLEAITQMQAGAAASGNEKALDQLCTIKAKLIGLE